MEQTTKHASDAKGKAKTSYKNLPANAQGRTAAEVTTFKSLRGTLVSTVQWGSLDAKDACSMFSFLMYQDEHRRLIEITPKRVTAKLINEQHALAVKFFEESLAK